MTDIKTAIAHIKETQAFQRSLVYNPEAFGLDVTPIEAAILKLIFLCGVLHSDGITAILGVLIPQQQTLNAIDRLCGIGYLWTEDGYYALSRKAVGYTLPKGFEKSYSKASISKSAYEAYRLKGCALSRAVKSYKIDLTQAATYNLSVLISTLAQKRTTITRFGSHNIFAALEQYQKEHPYICIMERHEKSTARKAEISGQFAAVAAKIKALTDDSPDKSRFLEIYGGYEDYLTKLDKEISRLEESALILPTSTDSGMPDMKLVTLKILADSNIVIQNVARDRLRLVYSVLDNTPQPMGAGLLFSRLCLSQALNTKLQIYDPIYRIFTRNGDKMKKTVADAVEKSRDYLTFFPNIETQIEIMEV